MTLFALKQACKMRWSGQWPHEGQDPSNADICNMLGIEELHIDSQNTGKNLLATYLFLFWFDIF